MKPKLRKELRTHRRAYSAAEHAARSRLAAKVVTASRWFRSGKRVALYLPFDGETDTSGLIRVARERGIHLYVPVIVDRRHSLIRFFPLQGAMRRGTFGILVPKLSAQSIPARWLDLIVMPLVGVDASGRRLGFGGGFYDRALNFRRHRGSWHGPHLLGFAFDAQRTTAHFAQPWDARLDSLATESGLRHYRDDP
jgi:5-formyltetrahydrofolate cyclo-ligase